MLIESLRLCVLNDRETGKTDFMNSPPVTTRRVKSSVPSSN